MTNSAALPPDDATAPIGNVVQAPTSPEATDDTLGENRIDDAGALLALEDVKRSEHRLQNVLAAALSGGRRPIYARHLFIFGIARRALAQSFGFRQMVDARNGLVAAALVRLQLDTVLRLYALFWVSDPDDFAQRVMKGEQINRIKASDGEVMQDAYLRRRLAPKNPWIDAVYKQTSGFIHFSDRHMTAALSAKPGGGLGEVEMRIGPTDVDATVGYYGELLRVFVHMNEMMAVAIEDALLRIDGKRLQ